MIETKVLPGAAEEFRDIYILKMGDAGGGRIHGAYHVFNVFK